MEEAKNKTGMGVAALVLGIISILSVMFWYIAFPTSILAIIFGIKSAKKVGSKLGKAGLITGIIGIAITTFLYVSMILIIIVSSIY